MTVMLELTTDIEQALDRKAKKLGLTISEYLRRMVERAAKPARTARASKPEANRPKTGAELADELDALNIPAEYGDPSLTALEVANRRATSFSRPDRETAQ